MPEAGAMRELLRLSIGYVFLHACMAGMRMAAPLYALKEGYSAAAVGVLMALFAVTQIFLALPAGRFADRYGVRRPMLLSMWVAAGGGLLAFAFPLFPVLCVAAGLTGGAVGVASIATQRHVGRLAQTPMQLQQGFSYMSIGPAVANFAGPFLAGLLIDNAGYRIAFLALGLMPLAAWFFLRLVPVLPPLVYPPARKGERAWDLWRDPPFRRLLTANWLLSSSWDVHTFLVPVLGHERGISASVIGTILGAFAIAAALVRVVLPLLAGRMRESGLILYAMGATALLFGVYPLLHSPLAMGICSALLGVALGSVQPMIMSLLHQITPEHRHGEAVGMRVVVINVSSVSMPLLFGAVGALVGVSAVFWTVACVLGGGIRVARTLRDVGQAHGADAARGDRKSE